MWEEGWRAAQADLGLFPTKKIHLLVQKCGGAPVPPPCCVPGGATGVSSPARGLRARPPGTGAAPSPRAGSGAGFAPHPRVSPGRSGRGGFRSSTGPDPARPPPCPPGEGKGGTWAWRGLWGPGLGLGETPRAPVLGTGSGGMEGAVGCVGAVGYWGGCMLQGVGCALWGAGFGV